jgi:hypothetical protein
MERKSPTGKTMLVIDNEELDDGQAPPFTHMKHRTQRTEALMGWCQVTMMAKEVISESRA